ncbi:TPA: CopG family transcriptional regulator, partial [Morganella morganii]|nr:CopG family transcriptional regulator [Morganella morganii]
YQQFITRLDMAPQSGEALKKTMLAKAPWEK